MTALKDSVSHPRQNILLHRGDVVTMITNSNSFTSIGATNRAQRIGFSVKDLLLAGTVGRMGGPQDYRADARSVFVFRYTPMAELPSGKQGKQTAQGYDNEAKIPMMYCLNLLDTHSLFWMQRSPIKDKDVIYASNASLSEVRKFLSFVFSPVTNSASNINSLAS